MWPLSTFREAICSVLSGGILSFFSYQVSEQLDIPGGPDPVPLAVVHPGEVVHDSGFPTAQVESEVDEPVRDA